MDNSRFRRLSTDLRSKIWERVVCPHGRLMLHFNDNGEIYLFTEVHRKNFLALLGVCKTIHFESMPVFYSRNTFSFRTSAFDEIRLGSNVEPVRSSPQSRLVLHAAQVTFEAKQREWSSCLRTWLNHIGPIGITNLRNLEIDVGIWHLNKPAQNDGVVAPTIGRLLHSDQLSYPTIEFKVNIRIGIPTSSQTPCIEELQLPITNPDLAQELLKVVFDDKLTQLDRLWTQHKISAIAFRILKRDVLRCQQRLERFVEVASSPPPRWTKEDDAELAALLRKHSAVQKMDSNRIPRRKVSDEDKSREDTPLLKPKGLCGETITTATGPLTPPGRELSKQRHGRTAVSRKLPDTAMTVRNDEKQRRVFTAAVLSGIGLWSKQSSAS